MPHQLTAFDSQRLVTGLASAVVEVLPEMSPHLARALAERWVEQMLLVYRDAAKAHVLVHSMPPESVEQLKQIAAQMPQAYLCEPEPIDHLQQARQYVRHLLRASA